MTLEEAQAIVTRSHAKAAELGIHITVAVVDDGGHLVALGRMDGAPSISAQVAEAKAVGAAMLHRDGQSLADLAKDRPGFIKRDGRVVGAVGVSGGKPDQDLECAEAGLTAI